MECYNISFSVSVAYLLLDKSFDVVIPNHSYNVFQYSQKLLAFVGKLPLLYAELEQRSLKVLESIDKPFHHDDIITHFHELLDGSQMTHTGVLSLFLHACLQ